MICCGCYAVVPRRGCLRCLVVGPAACAWAVGAAGFNWQCMALCCGLGCYIRLLLSPRCRSMVAANLASCSAVDWIVVLLQMMPWLLCVWWAGSLYDVL
jgi:hypothetical protein